MNKENAMTLTMRQGDVGIIVVDKLPDGAKELPREKGRVVLAHGEVTGHAHTITSPHATFFEAKDGRRFLEARNPLVLRHEEHADVRIAPGIYQVRIQREYTPEAIRNVLD